MLVFVLRHQNGHQKHEDTPKVPRPCLQTSLMSNIAIAPKVRPHHGVGFIVVYEVILCLTPQQEAAERGTNICLSDSRTPFRIICRHLLSDELWD